jgi:hypothetical protein
MHSYQATSGDTQPAPSQVNGLSGSIQLRWATGLV